MPHVRTTITYLEMLTPAASEKPLDARLKLRRAAPQIDEYRTWYTRVGDAYQWWDRLRMPVEQLRAILSADGVEVYLLLVADEPAGFAELDRRTAGEVELAYFGLFPEFVGQGWGAQFLKLTLAQAWSTSPRRVWVHTCDLDHPAALATYLRGGFRIYQQRQSDQPLGLD